MNELLVGYARVSTEQQDLTSQRNGLHALDVGDDRIYVDHGLTDKNRDRPGLRLALAACRAGDTLVVTKLDRLARSLPDARDILDELTKRNVKLSLGGSIHDPTDPVGRLMFNVLAMVAEFEADLIRMRTREGMKIAKAKGRLRGKQPKLKPNQTRLHHAAVQCARRGRSPRRHLRAHMSDGEVDVRHQRHRLETPERVRRRAGVGGRYRRPATASARSVSLARPPPGRGASGRGMPFFVLADVLEGETQPATRSLTVWETRTSDGSARILVGGRHRRAKSEVGRALNGFLHQAYAPARADLFLLRSREPSRAEVLRRVWGQARRAG